MGNPEVKRWLVVIVKRPKSVSIVKGPFKNNNIKDVVRWIEDQKMLWPNTSFEPAWLESL